MTCMTWRVQIAEDGSHSLSAPREAKNLSETGSFLPEGAYTTLRTYRYTGLILLDHHFDRLENTARLLGYPVQLNRSALRDLICQVLRRLAFSGSESRLRLTVDCTQQPGEIWISTEPLILPSGRTYRQGTAVVTRSMHRDNPIAKDSAFIAASREARTLKSQRINEVLMVGAEGGVLEGLSSNFFGIRDGTLITADEGVLPGLTRSLILDEVQKAGIPLRFESLPAEELSDLDEAFISSTSRAVLPIVEVDGHSIANGKPGPLTQKIRKLYKARLKTEIERVCRSF
ncbi:MAG: aminotransferase class IV [Ardenticatenaceae bacterium]